MKNGNKVITMAKVLLFCLCCAITLAITSGLTKLTPQPWGNYISLSAAIVVTIVLTLLFSRWEKITLENIGFNPGKNSAIHLFPGFVIGLVMAVLQALLLLLLNHHIYLRFAGNMSVTTVFASFVLYSLVAVREEIAFRAYPLRALNHVFGVWIALAVIFIVFSLEHVLGGQTWLSAFIGAGVGSIMFGVAALATRGIAMPIGLHMAWNFGQWCLGFKDNTGIWRAVIDKGFEKQVEVSGFVTYFTVMAIAVASIGAYRRLRRDSL